MKAKVQCASFMCKKECYLCMIEEREREGALLSAGIKLSRAYELPGNRNGCMFYAGRICLFPFS